MIVLLTLLFAGASADRIFVVTGNLTCNSKLVTNAEFRLVDNNYVFLKPTIGKTIVDHGYYRLATDLECNTIFATLEIIHNCFQSTFIIGGDENYMGEMTQITIGKHTFTEGKYVMTLNIELHDHIYRPAPPFANYIGFIAKVFLDLGRSAQKLWSNEIDCDGS
ncbi:unnamed protein product [Caenorhabditis bovis]|uniref:Uncharacterized protein n=1 Tax=Caenorhabditis bovis TaxID=2654633 RepID=A0A8S1FBT1_9PELO|nr:unnamed protein product [Caenorhabditis bovis]